MMRRSVVGVLIALVAWPLAAGAEYRLRVANLHESAYFAYAERPRTGNRRSGFSLTRLEEALGRAAVPPAVFVANRVLEPADSTTARAFQAAEIVASPAPGRATQWQEARWDGKAGQRAVWVIRGDGIHQPEVTGIGLPGAGGGLRHYHPYDVTASRARLRVARLSQTLMESWIARDGLWPRVLAPVLDTTDGIAAVVMHSQNRVYIDSVFLVIEQPEGSATYSVAIAWRPRGRGFDPFFEGAGGGSDVNIN
jgi:hypothetical protein